MELNGANSKRSKLSRERVEQNHNRQFGNDEFSNCILPAFNVTCIGDIFQHAIF